MQPLGLILSLTASSLIFGLIILFLRRRLYRDFPWFFIYLASSIIMTVVRLAFRGDYVTVYKIFWATEAIYAILALAALNEVFRRVFRAFYLFWWFWPVFPATVVALVLLTLRSATRVPAEVPQIIKWVLAIGVTAKYVEAGLFVLFVVLALLLNVTWRTHAFGVVQGFAISALGAWFAYAVSSEFGIKVTSLAIYSPPVAYIVAVVIWLITFARPEAPTAIERWVLAITPDELLAEIKQNTTVLWRLIRKRNGK
jgi:hypothetical protein